MLLDTQLTTNRRDISIARAVQRALDVANTDSPDNFETAFAEALVIELDDTDIDLGQFLDSFTAFYHNS